MASNKNNVPDLIAISDLQLQAVRNAVKLIVDATHTIHPLGAVMSNVQVLESIINLGSKQKEGKEQ